MLRIVFVQERPEFPRIRGTKIACLQRHYVSGEHFFYYQDMIQQRVHESLEELEMMEIFESKMILPKWWTI